jgi:luciferase family oxidoreductase group 1
MQRLEHPGRIDLGIGRAPGTDQITAYALRRSLDPSADDLPRQLAELRAFFSGTYPRITAVPGSGHSPAIWLLGSSDFSARLAAELGLPFSFAHHFMPQNTLAAVDIYRHHFQPSPTLPEPYTMIGVARLRCQPAVAYASYSFMAGRSTERANESRVAYHRVPWSPAPAMERRRAPSRWHRLAASSSAANPLRIGIADRELIRFS